MGNFIQNLFADILKSTDSPLHIWLLRIGIFLFIFGGIGQVIGLGELLFDIKDGNEGWFMLLGFILIALGLFIYMSEKNIPLNWPAIVILVLISVIGLSIYIVERLVDAPPPTVIAQATFTATPVTPTATPVTPTVTPVTPTATPVTPTATPVTPTATSVTPTATPVTPTATPVTPTAAPVTPAATAVSVYWHIVRSDENLSCIAENYYGDAFYWIRVCSYNQEIKRISRETCDDITPGREIGIPTSALEGYSTLPSVLPPPHIPDACPTAVPSVTPTP